jgi:diguanylate cyclase (GGDEF)-like protein
MKDTGLETGLAQLQQRIDTLLTQAQDNELIQQRCHQQELALIASHGLGEYLHQLLVDMPTAFALDAITLHLHDPGHIIRHLVEAEGIVIGTPGALRFHDDDRDALSPFSQSSLPLLQPFDAAAHQGLFEARQAPLGSVAMLPLRRGERLLGMLNLASGDPSRFTPARATDFLQHLAAIAAVCLENAVNHERLRHLGLTDALTGVRNRRYFEQRLLDECHAAQRHSRSLACLFLDLDHFKQINDRHGHHNGDRVLQHTATRIRQQLREGDLLSRYGGEEFVVLLLDTDAGTATEVAERIRSAVAKREVELAGGTSLAVTLSIGVAVIEGPSEVGAEGLAAQLVEAADTALYRAKESGRNRVIVSASLPWREAEGRHDDSG